MARLALLIIITAVISTFASPAPAINGSLVELENRNGAPVWHNGTVFAYNPGKFSCGNIQASGTQDHVVAIGHGLYDRNGGSNCGQWIQILNPRQKMRVYGLTVDRCQFCGDSDLAMAYPFFNEIAQGSWRAVDNIFWDFMPQGWHP